MNAFGFPYQIIYKNPAVHVLHPSAVFQNYARYLHAVPITVRALRMDIFFHALGGCLASLDKMTALHLFPVLSSPASNTGAATHSVRCFEPDKLLKQYSKVIGSLCCRFALAYGLGFQFLNRLVVFTLKRTEACSLNAG
jgi:hypothetical protein